MAIFIPHSPFEVKSAFGEFPIPQTKMFDGELEALQSTIDEYFFQQKINSYENKYQNWKVK